MASFHNVGGTSGVKRRCQGEDPHLAGVPAPVTLSQSSLLPPRLALLTPSHPSTWVL